MNNPESPPPPPQDGLAHVEPPEAASAAPKKRPWSKPTIRAGDGVLWTSSGPKFHTQATENQFYSNTTS